MVLLLSSFLLFLLFLPFLPPFLLLGVPTFPTLSCVCLFCSSSWCRDDKEIRTKKSKKTHKIYHLCEKVSFRSFFDKLKTDRFISGLEKYYNGLKESYNIIIRILLVFYMDKICKIVSSK